MFEWRTASPESQGLATAQLDAFRDFLVTRQTKILLVVKNDRIVYEWYSPAQPANKPHHTASMAKALIGGVAAAVALTDGRLQLDDPAAKYIPQWQADPQKSRITLRHLGSHTSGISDAEEDKLPHDKLTGWKGDFWKRLGVPRDPFSISRDLAVLRAEPGAEFHYSNPGIAMLGYATTAALRNAPQKDVFTLLRDRVMRPIGVADAEWSMGYSGPFKVDGLTLHGNWGGANFTARAAARVVRLMLREGNWEGRQLISVEAVRATTADAGTPGQCGIGWWSTRELEIEGVPRDGYYASGAQGQLAVGIPSLKLIVIRNGGSLGGRGSAASFFPPLMKALNARTP